jgi:hypothetical protein
MSYTTSLGTSSVVVVESLREGDDPTGTNLFENTIAPALFQQDMLGELYVVSTRREFLGALDRTLQLARDGHAPILHIETHGDAEGLQFTSDEILKWAELAPVLSEINQACRMNLLVVAAACHGWFLGTVLKPIDRSPIFGVMGPADAAYPADLYLAMTKFYRTLLTRFDLLAALADMNGATSTGEWVYRFEWAEMLFCKVFRYYMQDLEEGETQEQRVNRLVADAARSQNLDVTRTMRLRAQFSTKLGDHKWWFEYYKTRFLMLDLFAENRSRFQQSFEECSRRASQREVTD